MIFIENFDSEYGYKRFRLRCANEIFEYAGLWFWYVIVLADSEHPDPEGGNPESSTRELMTQN